MSEGNCHSWRLRIPRPWHSLQRRVRRHMTLFSLRPLFELHIWRRALRLHHIHFRQFVVAELNTIWAVYALVANLKRQKKRNKKKPCLSTLENIASELKIHSTRSQQFPGGCPGNCENHKAGRVTYREQTIGWMSLCFSSLLLQCFLLLFEAENLGGKQCIYDYCTMKASRNYLIRLLTASSYSCPMPLGRKKIKKMIIKIQEIMYLLALSTSALFVLHEDREKTTWSPVIQLKRSLFVYMWML